MAKRANGSTQSKGKKGVSSVVIRNGVKCIARVIKDYLIKSKS